MQIAQIGPWEFEMPEGWAHKENASSTAYFEDSGGSKGLYVKFIDLSQPKATSQQVAEYVQDIHFRGFTDGTDNTWKIVDKRSSSDQEFTRSALDMYDAKAKYRVLSVVVCDSRSALQITVHDYLCEQYSSSQDPIVQLEYSITRSLASH